MTASAPREDQEDRSLAPGASPAAVHASLLPEDRDAFLAAYERAPGVLEEWRRRAVLQSNPAAFRRSVHRAAEFFTGHPVPDDEPFEVTRAHAGLQIAMYQVETVGPDIEAAIEGLPEDFQPSFCELRERDRVLPIRQVRVVPA